MWPPGSADTVCPRPSVTLTFDRLTLKLVCESHLRWGTLIPNLGTLGFWVLELFAMYVTDGHWQTDGQTKATLIAPFSTVGNIIIKTSKKVKRSILCDATKFLQFERYPYATERLEQRRCQSFDRSARLFVISAHDIWRMGNTRYVIPI